MARRYVRGALRRLRNRLSGEPTILMYHRIAEEPTDANGICIAPTRFREHLEILAGRHPVLPLPELVQRRRDGRLPRHAVALTFDDGYRDNLETAHPLLREHGMPATFFVATARIGARRDYWWDELERAVCRTETVPERLELRIGGQTSSWAVPDRRGDPAQPPPTGSTTAAPRLDLFQELLEILLRLTEPARLTVIDQLVAWADITTEAQVPALTAEDLSRLAADDLVEIGSHSVSHPMLTLLPAADRLRELRESRERLQQWTGTPIDSMAYPFGFYDAACVAAAGAAGYRFACTSVGRRVGRACDPLELPRLEVRDVDGDRFAHALRWLVPM